jgi:hypothetical protein
MLGDSPDSPALAEHCELIEDSLYYCAADVYMVDQAPVHIHYHHVIVASPQGIKLAHCPPSKFTPTSCAQQVESEV